MNKKILHLTQFIPKLFGITYLRIMQKIAIMKGETNERKQADTDF